MRTAEFILKDDLTNTLNEFIKAGSFSRNVRYWWKSEITILRKMQHSKDKHVKSMALNTIDYLCSYCYETGKEYLIQGKIEMAINIYQLGTMVLPESKYFYQQLSKLRASGNNHELYYAMQNNSQGIA